MALNIERFGHLPLWPFPMVIKFLPRSLEVKWKQINSSAGERQEEGRAPEGEGGSCSLRDVVFHGNCIVYNLSSALSDSETMHAILQLCKSQLI